MTPRSDPCQWHQDWCIPSLGRSHCKWNNLPLPSLFFSHHSGRLQHTTVSFKTQKLLWYHVIEFHRDFFFLLFLLFEKQASSSTQANWNTGKILSILSIMYGKCCSCCGIHQQFQTFQQLLLWSQSCPSVTQAAKVAPSLYHLIWAENDRQGREGGCRRAVGLNTAAESCQDLASPSPKWRSSILVFLCGSRLFQIYYMLFQKPWTEVAVCRDEKHGRDFPFCPSKAS